MLVMLYVSKVLEGKITSLEAVPKGLRQNVADYLTELGYDLSVLE